MRYPIRSEEYLGERISRFVLGGMIVLMIVASIVGQAIGMMMFAFIGLGFALKHKVFRSEDFSPDVKAQLAFDDEGFTLYRAGRQTFVPWPDVHKVTLNGRSDIKRQHYLVVYHNRGTRYKTSLVVDLQSIMEEKFGGFVPPDRSNATPGPVAYKYPQEAADEPEPLDGDIIL